MAVLISSGDTVGAICDVIYIFLCFKCERNLYECTILHNINCGYAEILYEIKKVYVTALLQLHIP